MTCPSAPNATMPPGAAADDERLLKDAIALVEGGRHGEGWSLLRPAVEHGTDNAVLCNVAGMARFRLGDRLEGLALIEHAASMAPGNAGILGNLGNALLGIGRTADAIEAYRRTTDLRADDASAWQNLCLALHHAGRDDEKAACLARFAALHPKDPWPEIRLGILAERREQTDDAAAHYAAAVARDPASTDALNRLGVMRGRQDRVAEAIACYRKVLDADPGNGIALSRIVLELERACAWAAAADCRARLIARSDAAMAAGRRTIELPFAQLAYQDDPAAILRLATAWSAEIAARAGAPLAPATNNRDPDRALRIGYLSHDFRTHAVAQLCHRVFALHDRTSVQPVAYSTGPDDGSPLRRAVVESVDRFRDLRPLSHRQAAETIRADAIDILVDLTGHTSGSRLEIAALRPAPLQASWLGYPGTSGAPFIDWLVADATVIPPGDERYYAEAICRLPDTYLPADDRQPIASTVPSRASQRLPATGFVFCSFNNMHKIEPVMFGIWMDLLREIPGSVLWLHAYNELAATNLRAAAQGHGIDPARLVFADRPDKATHLARASLADLALDTRLYNGHTTTLDMLWAGVPVLTVPGRTFQARVSAGLLQAIGLPELVAPDLDGYRALALDLARDPQKLAALRSKLAANRTTTPLFDTARFTRHLEAACRTIWRQYCAGGPPGDVDIDGGTP